MKEVKAVKAVLYVLKGGCTERRETWPQVPAWVPAMGAAMGLLHSRRLRPTWHLLGHLQGHPATPKQESLRKFGAGQQCTPV